MRNTCFSSGILGIVALSAATNAAIISGSVSEISDTTINLSAEGTADWAKYAPNGSSPPYFDTKASSSGTISDQSGAFNSVNIGSVQYSWSDGVALSSGTTGWYLVGSTGFNTLQFSATPSSVQPYHLRIYVALYGVSTGELTATIGSESYTGTFAQNVAGAKVSRFDVLFTPDTAIQNVDVAIRSTSGNVVYLGAATLAVVPEPATASMLSLGLFPLAARRRRSAHAR